MKNIIRIFILLLFLTQCVRADYIPHYSNSINYWGIGVMRLNTVSKIYKENNENSELVQKIYWDSLKNYNNLQKIPEYEAFVGFVPKNEYAFLTVTDEADDNWFEVCYNQKTGEKGWIKQGEDAKFYSWQDFIMQFGKKRGLYLFKDIRQTSKKLYAKPDIESTIIDNWKYEKFIQPYFVNGNWMIVKILDYDNMQKTGYIKWRENDGRLLLFVDLKH